MHKAEPAPDRYRDIITLGTRVIAKRETGVCDRGEIGICYEIYERGSGNRADPTAGGQGYSFIFQSGRYDGFSADDVDAFLLVTSQQDKSIKDYRFTSVHQLIEDWRENRFNFSEGGSLSRQSVLMNG